MKKFLLLLTLFLSAVGFAHAQSYSITFSSKSSKSTNLATSTNATTFVSSESQQYLIAKPVKACSSAFYGGSTDIEKTSIKLGASKKNGSITFSLSDTGKVKATKVTLDCQLFNNNSEVSTAIKVNNVESTDKVTDKTTTTPISITLPGTEISELKIETTGATSSSSARVFVTKITVEYDNQPTPLGDIVATCGATTMVDNGEYTFTEGDLLSFSAKNAESIVVTSETSGETLASGKSSCSWKATETEYEILNVIAKKSGDSDKKMSFSITVNKKTPPEVKMGDLIIKYNNLSVADNDKVEVTKGTTFSIFCENAEKITLTDYSDLSTIAEYTTATASWTPGIMNGQVLVAASREGESDKEILFELVVSEPVITTTTHPGAFRHIRSLDEIYEGGEYLLAAALTEEDNTVSRHLLTNLYKTTPTSESQKKYARVTPFEPTNDAYKLNTDNEVDASVRILSVSLTDDGHYIWRHNNETMTAQKNSNNFLAFYTDNFLTNATSTNYVTKTKIQIEEDGSADIYFPEATKNATDEVGYEKGRHIRLNTGNKQNGFHHLGSYVPESLNNETNKVNYSINYHPVELYGLTLDAPVITNQTETTVTFTGEEGTTIEYLPSKAEAQAIKSRVDLAAGAETWTIGPSHEVTINLPEPGNGYYVRSRYHQVVSPLTGFMIQNDGTLTGIEGIGAEAGADAPAEYYDLQGRRVANPVGGLYIRRTGSKVEKVFVK